MLLAHGLPPDHRGVKAITFLGTSRPGSVVAERSLGMWDVGGSIPGQIKDVKI